MLTYVSSVMTVQVQSNVVAAMLVELMGVDVAPVMPYFPVILIYAIIHLNDKNEFVRQTMHKLITRLLAAFGDAVRLILFACCVFFCASFIVCSFTHIHSLRPLFVAGCHAASHSDALPRPLAGRGAAQ